ncbi:MAG: hypothetical protein A4E62_02638 [Syntrophorhabdus sp. PtaU1.Bin002]|nr:MAG: hypothetical protein A4E62_02638 [Syntrophorhabdus sp. PtaU1.Bin002]
MFQKEKTLLLSVVGMVFLISACGTADVEINRTDASMEAIRVLPREAYQEVSSGRALLVCAYESEEACSKMLLQGAISLQKFKSKLSELEKDQPIIFYCA